MKTHTVSYTWSGQYSNKIDCTLTFTTRLEISEDDCRKAGVTPTTMMGVIDLVAAAQHKLVTWHHGSPYAWKTGWAWEGSKLAEQLALAVKELTGVLPVIDDWNLTHRVDDFIADLRHQDRMKAHA